MLVAMATGTGKTFTTVNQVYRLMKSGVAQRILFLVDRRALAAQAVRTFAAFEPEPGLKFDKIYEVYSQRFQREDFDENEKFDPKILPRHYLEDPQPGHAFVYVCTIQRMAINLFGRQAVFAGDLDSMDEDIVYRYEYERAVREGYLVDYDAVTIKSNVRINGIFLKEGEQVRLVDTASGVMQLDLLEDERHYDTSEIEQKITAPDPNRKIIEEVRKYALEHEGKYGFPKIPFRHELIDGGRRLRAVEQLRGAGQEQDNVWIFDRR